MNNNDIPVHREFFKGDYIVATGPVYDTNHSTSNKHERLLDQTYNGILNYQTTFQFSVILN